MSGTLSAISAKVVTQHAWICKTTCAMAVCVAFAKRACVRRKAFEVTCQNMWVALFACQLWNQDQKQLLDPLDKLQNRASMIAPNYRSYTDHRYLPSEQRLAKLNQLSLADRGKLQLAITIKILRGEIQSTLLQMFESYRIVTNTRTQPKHGLLPTAEVTVDEQDFMVVEREANKMVEEHGNRKR